MVISTLALLATAGGVRAQEGARRPNLVLILADDMGYSDLGCYGSEIATPNLDRLARGGLRFTQFYNAGRCCPTRAALLTGRYNHQAGVGHMLQDWARFGASYSNGLNESSAAVSEVLRPAGYRSYLVGKWHVGGFSAGQERNYPLSRGFDRFYGTHGGGNFFRPVPLVLDREPQTPGPGYYFTNAVTDHAVRFLEEHRRSPRGHPREQPYFLHVCYTAPHFPLHALPEDIAKYRGKYRDGWDALRLRRFARQQELGIVDKKWSLSSRDPVAQPWSAVKDPDEWDLRMAVHAAMIDRMDQGIGKILDSIRAAGEERNTLVLFLSDNGASAEALDSWPNPARGHRPGSLVGTADSHRCVEVGWANAANTPFREHKMWAHEGGISTPLIAYWPAGITGANRLTRQVGHVIDLAPTLLDAAGVTYPAALGERRLAPLAGRSLLPALRDQPPVERTLYWEHEGNRAVRRGDWKLVAAWQKPWELYDLAADRTETRDLAAAGCPQGAERVRELSALWQQWADEVGVVPWEKLPGASYRPQPGYRKKSEPPVP